MDCCYFFSLCYYECFQLFSDKPLEIPRGCALTFRSISQAWCGFLDISNILAEDCRKPDVGSSNVVGDPEKYHLFLHVLTHTHTRALTRVYTGHKQTRGTQHLCHTSIKGENVWISRWTLGELLRKVSKPPLRYVHRWAQRATCRCLRVWNSFPWSCSPRIPALAAVLDSRSNSDLDEAGGSQVNESIKYSLREREWGASLGGWRRIYC